MGSCMIKRDGTVWLGGQWIGSVDYEVPTNDVDKPRWPAYVEPGTRYIGEFPLQREAVAALVRAAQNSDVRPAGRARSSGGTA